MATRTVKAKTANATEAAAQPAATTTEQKYLMPIGVDKLLGDARQMFTQIVAGLPAKLRVDYMREGQFFKALVLRGPSNETLRQCHPGSLMAAFNNSASLGLTLNPIKKHCTIIARWNKAEKIFEADNLIMYQGLMYLATQAGIKDIRVDVVYSADKFEIERRSDGDFFIHKINTVTKRGSEGNDFQGVYVAARMPGATQCIVEWIPKEDIFAMRDRSDSYLKDGKPNPNSPWVGWFDEQAKKGGLKRASKRWEERVDRERELGRVQAGGGHRQQARGRALR
jgi:recombinational DNA repair protein RecT